MKRERSEIGPILTGVFISVFSAVIFVICAYRYETLQYHDWDLSLYANGMWNLIHGSPHLSISGKHLLGSHFTLIAYLFASVFYVFRHPLTLIAAQTLALALAASPIYLIARRKFGSFASSLFALIYLLYPPLLYVSLYEFHFEAFSALFLAMAFYGLAARKKGLFFVSCALALITKENVPLVVGSLGIYALLFRPGRRTLGLSAAIVAIFYFFLVTLELQPHFLPEGASGYALHYPKYGRNLAEIFRFMATHPATLIRDLFSSADKIKFLRDIFSPLLFLPLLRPEMLIIIAPILFKNLLSTVPTAHSIYWHYTATIAPFMAISLLYAVKKLKKHMKSALSLYLVLAAVLTAETVTGIRLHGQSHYFVKFHYPKNYQDSIKQNAVEKVPANSSVMATFDFLPKLSMREGLYAFFCLWRGGYYREAPKFEYALVDFNDYFVRQDLPDFSMKMCGIFTGLLTDPDWGVEYAEDDIVLFKRTGCGRKIAELIPSQKTGRTEKKDIILAADDGSLNLADIKIGPYEGGKVLPLTFYWSVEKPSASVYEMFFFSSDGKKEILFAVHPVAYRFYTPSLKKGEILKEEYRLVLPDLFDKNTDTILVGFADALKKRPVPIKTPAEGASDGKGRFIIKVE